MELEDILRQRLAQYHEDIRRMVREAIEKSGLEEGQAAPILQIVEVIIKQGLAAKR